MKLVLKAVMLALLIVLFLFLLSYWRKESGAVSSKVKIEEKYYSPESNGRVTGISTNDVVSVEPKSSDHSAVCAMKFSNNKILTLDCERYLDYRLGEEVKIRFRDGEVTEIQSVE
ncbi:hypothetical protein [Peribacillus sp. SCS-155]|uniref:hypothetical protein n=1 Tax=Peribacillus sedimenti TaxID=3115297 RepID=UPI00390595E7